MGWLCLWVLWALLDAHMCTLSLVLPLTCACASPPCSWHPLSHSCISLLVHPLSCLCIPSLIHPPSCSCIPSPHLGIPSLVHPQSHLCILHLTPASTVSLLHPVSLMHPHFTHASHLVSLVHPQSHLCTPRSHFHASPCHALSPLHSSLCTALPPTLRPSQQCCAPIIWPVPCLCEAKKKGGRDLHCTCLSALITCSCGLACVHSCLSEAHPHSCSCSSADADLLLSLTLHKYLPCLIYNMHLLKYLMQLND